MFKVLWEGIPNVESKKKKKEKRKCEGHESCARIAGFSACGCQSIVLKTSVVRLLVPLYFMVYINGLIVSAMSSVGYNNIRSNYQSIALSTSIFLV